MDNTKAKTFIAKINTMTFKELLALRENLYNARLDKDEEERNESYMRLGLIEEKLSFYDAITHICHQN